MPLSTSRWILFLFLLPLSLPAQNQQPPSASPDLRGSLSNENIYSNPALGVTMVLPRKWQFVDKELQARLQGSSTSRETPPDPNCTGPLCHLRIQATLITKPGQAPVDYITFSAFQLSPQYRDRERFPLRRFAQAMIIDSVPHSDWIVDGELTQIQIDGKPAYRLLMHTSGLVKKKGYGYVFDANDHVVLLIGTTTYVMDSKSQLQTAIENMKLHTEQEPKAR
jgi:hypothetical protein